MMELSKQVLQKVSFDSRLFKKELVKALMPVVTEEWGHFRMVLREMEKRDMTLGFQRKDEYVNALQKFRKHGNRDVNLIESLLILSLIHI